MKETQTPMMDKKGLTDSIKKLVLEEKKLDRKVLKGLGRGKWDLIRVDIHPKRVRIYSSDGENLLIKVIKQIIPEERISLAITSLMHSGSKISRLEGWIIKQLIEKGANIRISLLEDGSSINSRLESSGPKEEVVETLSLFLGLHKSSSPYNEKTEIILTFGNYIIFRIENKKSEIQFDIKDEKILETLNMILVSNNKSVPCSYQFSVIINKITGKWETGKREGYLIQELKDVTGKRRRKFKL
ncbi:hypothetical protein FJZ53_00205 [Candidatus Woesearchaeota archaeon]|nr:hypothetical protein [Candidatus Woesearchaeota archaeon]